MIVCVCVYYVLLVDMYNTHSGECILIMMHLNHQLIELRNYHILMETKSTNEKRKRNECVKNVNVFFERLFCQIE